MRRGARGFATRDRAPTQAITLVHRLTLALAEHVGPDSDSVADQLVATAAAFLKQHNAATGLPPLYLLHHASDQYEASEFVVGDENLRERLASLMDGYRDDDDDPDDGLLVNQIPATFTGRGVFPLTFEGENDFERMRVRVERAG